MKLSLLCVCLFTSAAAVAYADCTSVPETPKDMKSIVDWEKINSSDPSYTGCVITIDGHKEIVDGFDETSNPQPVNFSCSSFCEAMQRKTVTINLSGPMPQIPPSREEGGLSVPCHDKVFEILGRAVPIDRQDRVCFNHVIKRPLVTFLRDLSLVGDFCPSSEEASILKDLQRAFSFTIESAYGANALPDYGNIYNTVAELNKNHGKNGKIADGEITVGEGQLCYSPAYIDSFLFGGTPPFLLEGMGLAYKSTPPN